MPGADDDEDPLSSTTHVSAAPSPPPAPQAAAPSTLLAPDPANAQPTLSPAKWDTQASTTALPAAVVLTVSTPVPAAPPKTRSSSKRGTGSRGSGTSTNSRNLSTEEDGVPHAPSTSSASSSSSAFRVLRAPDPPASALASPEDPQESQEQPRSKQLETPQNEHIRQVDGRKEPQKEEEEEEPDKQEEEEETPPPTIPTLPALPTPPRLLTPPAPPTPPRQQTTPAPPTPSRLSTPSPPTPPRLPTPPPPTPSPPPPKHVEPILKPIPSPPWASDGFRPDAPPPPRNQIAIREVGSAVRARFGVKIGVRGAGAGRGIGNGKGRGVWREVQTGRGLHTHAQSVHGSTPGGMLASEVLMLVVASAAAPPQTTYANPYANPYSYPRRDLQQPDTNAYPYPFTASYATSTREYVPLRDQRVYDSSTTPHVAPSQHQPSNRNHYEKLQEREAQKQFQLQQTKKQHSAEERRPQTNAQPPPQPPPPPPKYSHGTPPDQTPYPHAPYNYSSSQNQQQQPPQPAHHRVVATTYIPAPSSPRKRNRSQSPFHPKLPPPPPWYTPAQTQAHTQALTHAPVPVRGSMSGAIAPVRGSMSDAVVMGSSSPSRKVYASLALSPSPSPSPPRLDGHLRRVRPRAGGLSRSRSRSRSRSWDRGQNRGQNRSLSMGRNVSISRSPSVTSFEESSSSWSRDGAGWSRGGSAGGGWQGPRPASATVAELERARAKQSGSEMEVDDEPCIHTRNQKGKGKEKEQDRPYVYTRHRSASLSPMRVDTSFHNAPRLPHPHADPDPHSLRWTNLPSPVSGLHPAWPQSSSYPRPTTSTAQAPASRPVSPSTTDLNCDYDYTIEHSPPAPDHAMLRGDAEEREGGRERYSPRMAPIPMFHMYHDIRSRSRSRSRSRTPAPEQESQPLRQAPPPRSMYTATSSAQPVGAQPYEYLASQPQPFIPPPQGLTNERHEQEQPPSPKPSRRNTASFSKEYAASTRGQRAPPPSKKVRSYHVGAMPAYPISESSMYQHHSPQPLDRQNVEDLQHQQKQRHKQMYDSLQSQRQPIRPRPSDQVQPTHRVIIPATAADPSLSASAPGPSNSAHASSPTQPPSFQYRQGYFPQPPAPPPPPQTKPPNPAKGRTRRLPLPWTPPPGTTDFDRPHPNPTVSMRTIPQPPPQLVAQQLSVQLGIPMGSTNLQGTLVPPAVAAGSLSRAEVGPSSVGSASAVGMAVPAPMGMGSGLGEGTVLPPDLQVGAHLRQVVDAARLAQKVRKAKHRKSQSAQSAGGGTSPSRAHQPTSVSNISTSTITAPPAVPSDQSIQFGPLQHFQTTLFPQEHLLLDMHSVGGAQFVLKPPRNVKGGRGVYGSYGIVLDGVSGMPMNVGGNSRPDARSSGTGGSGVTSGIGGQTTMGGGTNVQSGAGANGQAENGDEPGALRNVLVVKRRRFPGGAQELAAPDPTAGGPHVVGGRLMTPPPVEQRPIVMHTSVWDAAATSTGVFAVSEGRGNARGRPKGGGPSRSSGKGKEREVDRQGWRGTDQALGTADAPLTISDDDEDSRIDANHSPIAPPIQIHLDSPWNDPPDDSDPESEEEDELESEDSNGGTGYIQIGAHAHARAASALLSVPTTARHPRRVTRTSSAPSTSRSSSHTRGVAVAKQRNGSAQNSRAPGASGTKGKEANTFAAPARPSRKNKKYSCDVCDQIFTRSGDVRRHKDTRHNTDGGGGCRCPFCGRVLTRQDALQRHWDKYCRRRSKRHLDRSSAGMASGMGVYGLMHRSYLDPLPHVSNLGGRLVSDEDEIRAAMVMATVMVQSGGGAPVAGPSTVPSRTSSGSGSQSRGSSAYGQRFPNEDEEDEEELDDDGYEEEGANHMDMDNQARPARRDRSAEQAPNAPFPDQPNDNGMDMSGVE